LDADKPSSALIDILSADVLSHIFTKQLMHFVYDFIRMAIVPAPEEVTNERWCNVM
jgi:hypothetical protein